MSAFNVVMVDVLFCFLLPFGNHFLIFQASSNIFNILTIYYVLSGISHFILFSIQLCKLWFTKGFYAAVICYCCLHLFL